MIIRQLSALGALATCFYVLFRQRRVCGWKSTKRMILAPLVNKFNISVWFFFILYQLLCTRAVAHILKIYLIYFYYICFQTTPITSISSFLLLFLLSISYPTQVSIVIYHLCKFVLLKRKFACAICESFIKTGSMRGGVTEKILFRLSFDMNASAKNTFFSIK